MECKELILVFKGIKKNSTKTKAKQLSKDMISAPQADVVHAFHVGVTGNRKRTWNNWNINSRYLGDSFGDINCLNQVESTEQKPVGYDENFFIENSMVLFRRKNNLHLY